MNRLTASYTHTAIGGSATTWNNTTIDAAYAEFFVYDANGNIRVMNRFGANLTGMPLNMDQLMYNYNLDGNGKLVNNRLNYIMDFMPNNAYTVDIDNQSANNYKYDKIGNLIGDVATGMNGTTNRINWTVYGKIASIKKSAGTTSYGYDAGGNRITKTLSATKADYYVRDAQGNVMGIYSYDNTSFTWAEQHLYGSSRVGMVTPGLTIQSSTPLANASYNATGDPITNGTEGKRVYELSNHLGNVMVTISDRKIGVDEDSDTVIDYYTAEVLTSQDYYAFGMLMPGRQYSNAGAKYKYGFNGQENDNDVKGEGNQINYIDRSYDPRIGRWISPDKLPKVDLSSYQFSLNNPLIFIDQDGNDEYLFHANGTWTVTRAKGPDVFKKEDVETNTFKVLNSRWPSDFTLSSIGKLDDLNFISQFALENSSFQKDINQHQGEGETLEAHNELAYYAWGYAIITGVEKAFEIRTLGIKSGAKDVSVLALKEAAKGVKKTYKSLKDVKGKFGRYRIKFEDKTNYVGKTIREFKVRLSEHMRGAFRDKKIKKIEVQELKTPRKDLKEHEGEWYDKLIQAGEEMLNKIRPNQKKN